MACFLSLGGTCDNRSNNDTNSVERDMEFKQIEERLESISEQLEEEKEQRLFNERREWFRMYQELERQKELKEAGKRQRRWQPLQETHEEYRKRRALEGR